MPTSHHPHGGLWCQGRNSFIHPLTEGLIHSFVQEFPKLLDLIGKVGSLPFCNEP